MSDIKIPPKMWQEFLKTFTERHARWLVQVETHDTQTDETVSAPVSALQSVEWDDEDEKNPRINITVRYDSKELKQILFRPSQVILHIPEQNTEDSLRISSLNTCTTIRMHGGKTIDVLSLLSSKQESK